MATPLRTRPVGQKALRTRPIVYQDEDAPHPELGRLDRTRLVELDPDDAVNTLKTDLGFEAEHIGGGHIRIKRPGEKTWKRVDPSYFEPLEDIGDIGPLAAQIVASAPLTGKAAVAGTAAFGPVGGVIAGSLAFGGQMLGTEALKQGALKATGAEVSLKGAAKRSLEEGAYGLAGELGGRAIAGGVRMAGGALRGAGKAVQQGARETPYAAREFLEAAAKKGPQGRVALEEAGKRFGLDPTDMKAMGDNELAMALEKSQPGGAFRERGVVEQSGKLIDESMGSDLDIVTRRRNPKPDNFDPDIIVAQKGDIRRFPQAQYGPYQGTVLSKEQVREGARDISMTDLRSWIQKEFGEARPIVVQRHGRTMRGLPTKGTKAKEVTLNQMTKNEMVDFIFENQKGKTTLPFGTSRAEDVAKELRTVVERNTPHLEMGRSWRKVNLRDVESIKGAKGALDFTKPTWKGKAGRTLIGARGPLSQDLLGRFGNVLGKVERGLKLPGEVASNVVGIENPSIRTAMAFGSMGFGPVGKAIGTSYVAGGVVGAFGKIARRDSGNLVEFLLSRADLPASIARQAKRAHDALRKRGIDAYRSAMLTLVHSPEFQVWAQGAEDDQQ